MGGEFANTTAEDCRTDLLEVGQNGAGIHQLGRSIARAAGWEMEPGVNIPIPIFTQRFKNYPD